MEEDWVWGSGFRGSGLQVEESEGAGWDSASRSERPKLESYIPPKSAPLPAKHDIQVVAVAKHLCRLASEAIGPKKCVSG